MKRAFLFALFLFAALPAFATVFGTVRGIVHDPQHRPVSGIQVVLKAKASDFILNARTDDAGQFHFDAVPIGKHTVAIVDANFVADQQSVAVLSGTAPILHFELRLPSQNETVVVSADAAQTETVTPTSLVDRLQIQETPGASRTNSLALITDYVPGAYVVHDQLHIRGGHQVSWLIDGVPVPNTNIASNVGPQFDPKDIDFLEVQRGSYGAQYGDRTYGVFNVVPRSGFERNNDAELVVSAGNFYQTNDQLSVGGHSQRFAYFVSGNFNRSDLGLGTPVADVMHDREAGGGGFASLIFNVNPANQLRVVTSVRRDSYQIPNGPDDQAAGINDVERESDAFVNVSWVRTFNSGMLLTVSPFYHYNTANFEGGPSDPIVTVDERRSQYGGAQATLTTEIAKNNRQAGF